MPTARARRLCPDAAFVAPRIDLYAAASRAGDGDPAVGDAAGGAARRSTRRSSTSRGRGAACSGPGPRSRAALRRRIRDELGLDRVGRRGHHQDAGQDRERRRRSPTVCSWSSPGPSSRSSTRCRCGGCGASARRPSASSTASASTPSASWPRSPSRCSSTSSATRPGRHLHALADNRDARRWSRTGSRSRSVTRRRSPRPQRSTRARAGRVRMAERVAARLREHEKAARTVQLKLRYRDFATITRAHTLPEPTDLARHIGARGARAARRGRPRATASACSASPRSATRRRGRGPGAAAVGDRSGRAAAATRRRARAHVDAVRARFGDDAVGRAAHAVDGPRAHRPAWQPLGSGRRRRRTCGSPAGRRGVTCCASR